jgi:mono/diheme cytochrome c family protein
MLFKRFLILTFLAVSVVSCTTSLYKPTLVEAADTNEFNNLQKGRELYINNCASCHSLYLPDQFTPQIWKEELLKMQTKAKLSDSETELIYNYLTGKKQPK